MTSGELQVTAIATLNEAQMQDLQEIYKTTWWAKERQLPDINLMLQQCDIVVGLCELETNKLVGFTRVLTDYIYRAFIFDVIVAAEMRGKGLGTRLLREVLDHPRLQKVELFQLACLPDMVPFYAKVGFQISTAGMTGMFLKRNTSSNSLKNY
ncbi:GNAT family N-acetyltransferase [Thalassoporum mexicanum]|uniref:GNAT family N-acetyltransferase n=1 Tax=Thalassoporum mexicanum TaxID=3457544 RepID=UPI0005A29933|nr:GNAT family N-acetyltransferase [Pseudanabaena sp. PCC 7367]